MRKSLLFVAVVTCGMAGACVPPEPLVVQPSALPNGVVGLAYSQSLNVDSESGARWSVSDGALPPGLQLDSRTGTIAGTPSEAGSYLFTVQAIEAGGFREGGATYTLTILERLQVGATLPVGRVQEAYSGAVPISGGVAPYTVSVIGLPAGLALDSTTGAISGTPIYPVDGELLQVTVTDSGEPQQTSGASVPLVIKNLPVRIVTDALPDVQIGSRNYSQAVQAADGVSPYSWAIVGGDLRALGLELVLSTGEIRNRRDAAGRPIPIPDTAAASTFTVEVTDSDVPPTTAVKEFHVGVVPAGD